MSNLASRTAPDDKALGHAPWAVSKLIMTIVDAAVDAYGDDIPIATFLILADVLKADGWRAQQLVDGVRYVFEHELTA